MKRLLLSIGDVAAMLLLVVWFGLVFSGYWFEMNWPVVLIPIAAATLFVTVVLLED